MKTLGQFSSTAVPLALAVSLVLFSGNLRAFGPGGAGNGGGTNGGGTTAGGSAGGGSRGGSAGGATTANSPGASGLRGGVSFSNSAPRGSTGTFAHGTGIRGSAPSGLSLPYHNVTNGSSPAAVTRPGNSWSGTAVGSNAAARPVYNGGGRTTNRFAGQHLDPGANGSNLPGVTNGWTDRGNGRSGTRNGNSYHRFPGRYYYYPYAYGPAYAPYIGYYGGGLPYYAGAYPYSNDVASGDADVSPGATTVTPQYVEQGPAGNDNVQPDPAGQPQPAPAARNPNGKTATQGTIPNNGPDSLVEAVQEELIRRGYFGGKVDAMFNPETKEALRKFQKDHHLAETGLINEATLHALQLD